MKTRIATLFLLGVVWGCAEAPGRSWRRGHDRQDRGSAQQGAARAFLKRPIRAEQADRRGAGLSGLTASDLATRHPVAHSPFGYDPSTAANLNLITASTLSPNAQELAVLGQQGFVISRSKGVSYLRLWLLAIYANDLPLFVFG